MREGKKGIQIYINSTLHEEMLKIKNITGISYTKMMEEGIKKHLEEIKKRFNIKEQL